MPILIGGVDGGQSSTTAVIADDRGHILGRGTGPAADLVGEARGSERQRNAVATALADALRDAGLPSQSPISALIVGLTGHDAGMPKPAGFDTLADAVAVVHDTVIAHAGTLGGEPGIVVLAGTGSVALGNASTDGAYVRAGGWGYFFGDAGSALWIARQAISWAMRDFDDAQPSQLGDAALRFFDLPDLRSLQHAFARGELSRPALAAFAAELMTSVPAAPTEPPSMPMQAWHLQMAAASELVRLVRAVHDRLPTVHARRISYAGGLFASKNLRRNFRDMIERGVTLPVGVRHVVLEDEAAATRPLAGSYVVEPAGDALDGAVSLARRLLRGERVEAQAING